MSSYHTSTYVTSFRRWSSAEKEPETRGPDRLSGLGDPAGSTYVVTEWGAAVHVEMSQERFHVLQLAKNELGFVTQKDIAVSQKR